MSDDLLAALIATRESMGTKELAQRLGVSPATIRSICTGHYPDPSKVLSTYAAQFINPPCPFTDAPINRIECDRHAEGNRPSGGWTLQQWWDTCQTCIYKGKRS